LLILDTLIISEDGIRPNPDKINTVKIIQFQKPRKKLKHTLVYSVIIESLYLTLLN